MSQSKYEEMKHIQKQREKNLDEYNQHTKVYEEKDKEFEEMYKILAVGSEILGDISKGWQGEEATVFLTQKESAMREIYEATQVEQKKNDSWLADKKKAYEKKESKLEKVYKELEKER